MSLGRLANRARDLAFLPGIDRLLARRRRGRIACLLYHRVADPGNDPFSFLTRGGVPATSPAEFASDLEYLLALGARFLTFDGIREGERPGPNEPGIVIAFDDCFADNYTTVLEILEARGIKAVFFQTSGLVNAAELIWEHALYWLGRDEAHRQRLARTANAVLQRLGLPAVAQAGSVVIDLRERTPWTVTRAILAEALAEPGAAPPPDTSARLYPRADQLRRAQALGHEIGNHGHQHLRRANVDAEIFRADLMEAQARLTELLGAAPRSYSFPFSSHLPGDEAICGEAGLVLAATVERDRDIALPMPYLVPRYTWPGPARNRMRQRRWLITVTI